MEPLNLYGKINDKGEFILSNRQRFAQWCRENKGKDISVKFERRNSKRSYPQNNYYWGVVVKEVALRLRDLGNTWLTDEDCHDLLKGKFNLVKLTGRIGEIIYSPRPTSGLNKDEFSEYIERIRGWAADFLEINIPDPDTELTLL